MDSLQELDKQINALEKQALKTKKEISSVNEMASADGGSLQHGKVTILHSNDHRTPYVPTVKLLKRDPTADLASSQAGMGDRKPSYKALRQREAEYAEARKRIFGDVEEAVNKDPVEILTSENNSPTLALR